MALLAHALVTCIAASATGSRYVQKSGVQESDGAAGCVTFIKTCADSSNPYSEAAFEAGNWTGWRLGFGLCCVSAGYTDTLCDSITEKLFDFDGLIAEGVQGFGGGDKALSAPQPELQKFCKEAADTLTLHADSEELQHSDSAAGGSSLLQRLSLAGKGALLGRRLGVAAAAEIAGSAFRRQGSRAELRAAMHHRIERCQRDETCQAETAVMMPSLLQALRGGRWLVPEDKHRTMVPNCHNLTAPSCSACLMYTQGGPRPDGQACVYVPFLHACLAEAETMPGEGPRPDFSCIEGFVPRGALPPSGVLLLLIAASFLFAH